MLNVSSNPADLLPQARIRLAALELLGEQGFDKTTIRAIAARAGVSPGLVIHHFGSKKQLRDAVDDGVFEVLKTDKATAIASAAMGRVDRYLDDFPDLWPTLTYIIRVLRDGGPAADRLFDRMVEVTSEMLELMGAQVPLRMGSDPKATITLMVAFSLGISIFGDSVARHLGGDTLADPEVMRRYSLGTIEMFTHGLFVDDGYLNTLRAAFTATEEDGND